MRACWSRVTTERDAAELLGLGRLADEALDLCTGTCPGTGNSVTLDIGDICDLLVGSAQNRGPTIPTPPIDITGYRQWRRPCGDARWRSASPAPPPDGFEHLFEQVQSSPAIAFAQPNTVEKLALLADLGWGRDLMGTASVAARRARPCRAAQRPPREDR
ncbi:MAG: hypothetical protein ACRDQ5_08500 [Sciscionella sp.]